MKTRKLKEESNYDSLISSFGTEAVARLSNITTTEITIILN